jgi:hypothetical protein
MQPICSDGVGDLIPKEAVEVKKKKHSTYLFRWGRVFDPLRSGGSFKKTHSTFVQMGWGI